MESTNLQRRAFLRGKSPRLEPNAIHPPWSLETSAFIEKCTRCDECISACPEKILKKGDGGYPEVNFIAGECTFCAKCVEACDSGAFKKTATKGDDLKPEDAWNLNITFKENCLSLNAVICRACGDHCDEQAIQFKLKLGGISEPQVDHEECTGCGACVSVCPVHAVKIS